MRNILPHNVHSQQEGKGEALRVLPTGTAISSLVDALPSSHADRNTAEQCQNMKDDNAMLCEVLDVNESSQNSAGHSVLDVSSGLSRVLNARSSSSGSGFELQSVPSQSQMCGSGFMDVRTMLSSQVQDISCEFDNSHGHVPAQQYKKSSKPSGTNNVSVMEPSIPLSPFTVLSLPEMSTSLPKETSEQARQSHRDASEPSIPNRKSTSIQPQEDKSGVEPMDDLAREPAPTCSSNISTFHMSNEKKVLIVQRQENDSNAQSCSNLSQKKHQTTLRDGKPSFPAADTYQGNSDSLSFASPGVLPSGPSHSRDVKPGRRKIRNKKKDVSCVGMDPMLNRNNVKGCSSSTSVPSCFALPYGNRHSVSQNEASPILSYSALSQPSARRDPTQPETLPPLVTPMNPIRAYYQGIPLGYSVLPHPQVPDAAAIHSSPLQGSAANAALPFSFWNILSTTVPHHSPSPSIYAAPSPFPITITERPGASCLNLVQQGNSQQHDETTSRSLPGPYYSPGAGFFPMSSCPSQTAPYVYQLALSPPSNACPSALSSNAPTHCSNGMYMYSVHAPESFSSSHPLRTPILISPSSVPLQPTSTSGAMNTLESSLLSESVKSSHHPVYRNLSSSEVQHSLDSAYPAQYTQPCHTPALTLEAQAETTTSSFASVYLQGNSTQPFRVSGPAVSSGPSLNSTQPPVFAISDERVSSRLIHEDTEVAVRWSQHPPREVCLQTSNLSNPHKETMTQNNGLSVGSSPLNLQEASTLAATIAAPPSVVAAEDWLRMFQNYRMKNSHGQCELQAHITELAVDQLRSRLLLDVLTCTNDTKRVTEAWHESEVCHLLITTIFEVSAKLRIDSVGYTVLCAAIRKADNKQRAEFYTMHIQGQVVALTLNAYGCRVVQTCMETLEESQRIALAQELNGHILTCIYNQNGNHVIQRCIQLLPFEACISIIDCVIAGAFELSTHMCGCRVVQRVLESSPPTVVTSIVSQLLPKLLYLVHDRYGNYVIQHLLVQSGNSSHKKVFLNDLIPQCYGLSLHKIASNVVEKMFLCASKEDRDAMITVFVTTKRRGKAKVGDAKRLLAMIQDSFGNYVIQKVLDHASASQFQRIAQHLRQLSPYLHQNLHGKHILDRVAKNPAVHECTGALEG